MNTFKSSGVGRLLSHSVMNIQITIHHLNKYRNECYFVIKQLVKYVYNMV
ncbi:hypothetical protein XBP1_110011 [Xenorhabdus bovienii str. puntauvense]|uniref:Transposase n=1 Tax=Xenorhabdus bovienii str. puntauvense TaxID=1398201 RepID=A0A077NAC5_XENBV|nr:hypothetical protein XBP1_110011 [Xenorhabdus bovienii str. puntauvense]